MTPNILLSLMAGAEGSASPWSTLIMLAVIFAIFYFLLIRPQKKQQEEHEEMVKNLEKGDRVVTVGGIIGEIIHLEENELVVKTSDGTRIDLERSKVGRKVNQGEQDES